MRIRTITPEEDAKICGYCGKTFRDHIFTYWERHQGYLARGKEPEWHEQRDFLLTDEEKRYIIKNIGKKTAEDIAADLGMTYSWFRTRVPSGTFPRGGRGKRVKFTKKDDDLIRKWWGKEQVRWIHKKLGKDCSCSTLSTHAIKDLGLPPYFRRFTKEEDDWIKDWWGRLTVKKMADIIDRSAATVRTRAVRDLGLPTPKQLEDPVFRLIFLTRSDEEE